MTMYQAYLYFRAKGFNASLALSKAKESPAKKHYGKLYAKPSGPFNPLNAKNAL